MRMCLRIREAFLSCLGRACQRKGQWEGKVESRGRDMGDGYRGKNEEGRGARWGRRLS